MFFSCENLSILGLIVSYSLFQKKWNFFFHQRLYYPLVISPSTEGSRKKICTGAPISLITPFCLLKNYVFFCVFFLADFVSLSLSNPYHAAVCKMFLFLICLCIFVGLVCGGFCILYFTYVILQHDEPERRRKRRSDYGTKRGPNKRTRIWPELE